MVRITLAPDWHEFLCALIDHRVKFLLVGGHAMAVHGQARFTKDLDVLVDATVANGRRLRAALIEFGFEQVAMQPEELAERGAGWMLGRPPLRIDILTAIDGIDFAEAWRSRIHVELDAGRAVPVIGRDALAKNKIAAGRPQDMADVARLGMLRADEKSTPVGTPKKATKKRRKRR